MVEKAREALKLGITELHIVGGLHPSLPFSYYVDMLKALSALNDESPNQASGGTGYRPLCPATCRTVRRQVADQGGQVPLHPNTSSTSNASPRLKILHLAWLAKKSRRADVARVEGRGLESLTGAARRFSQGSPQRHRKGKESAEEYLTFTALGIASRSSTCTMLFGHIESLADRVDHLRQLRALQDEARGQRVWSSGLSRFGAAFTPLPRPRHRTIETHNRRQ